MEVPTQRTQQAQHGWLTIITTYHVVRTPGARGRGELREVNQEREIEREVRRERKIERGKDWRTGGENECEEENACTPVRALH